MPPEVEAGLPYSGVYHSASAPDVPAGAYLQRDEGGLWEVAGISFDSKAPKATLEDALSWMKQVGIDDIALYIALCGAEQRQAPAGLEVIHACGD
jgi:hypothetical protein